MIRLRVREIIKERNINQSQISRLANIPLNTIQSMMRNDFHDPRISTLERLAGALHVDIADLYEKISDEEYDKYIKQRKRAED